MADLNVKIGSEKTLLEHVTRKHGFDDRINTIDGTLMEQRTSDKDSWDFTNRLQASNQIDHIPVSCRFKNYLLNVDNKTGAEMGLERD